MIGYRSAILYGADDILLIGAIDPKLYKSVVYQYLISGMYVAYKSRVAHMYY